jgi:hypothetical protein
MVDMYRTFKGAQAEFDEKILVVKSIWLKTSMQLTFIKSVESELGPEHHELHDEMLHLLCNKLRTACVKLEAVQKRRATKFTLNDEGSMRRLKYTFMKPYIEETIQALVKWQELYDPTWYLILRIGNQHIDTTLRTTTGDADSVIRHAATVRESLQPQSSTHVSVFLSSSRLNEAKTQIVPFSTARWGPLPGSSPTKFILIDRILCGGMDRDLITRGIRTFAVKLRSADPAKFSLLTCRGVVRVHDDAKALQGFDMILDFPPNSGRTPHSLRSSLISRHQYNLSDRFALARQMANATNYVHMFGFVHKGVRPENAICMNEDEARLGPFFLIGFEQVRLTDGRTHRSGNSDRWKDIYKHPSRQGMYPYRDYCMQHDIYSLGACLLEIGLWTSFVTYDIGNIPELDSKALGIDESQVPLSDCALKDRLVHLAKTDLPISMGSTYAEIVANCLTCLDEENNDFGDRSEFEDEDGILIGLKYIEKVSFAHFPNSRMILMTNRFYQDFATSQYKI